jgi:predicted ATPase/DNA-binding winged helix-turn-helix (wHTH) protein
MAVEGELRAKMKEFRPFRLDTVNKCLWRRKGTTDEERIRITPKAFDVLCYLVDHAGRLVTQDELLSALWPDSFVQPEVLKSHVLDIRQALGDHAKNPQFIETLPKRGYQFIASVLEPPTPTLAPMGFAVELPSRRLVGRNKQISQLTNCLQRTFENQRQIVFVTGEPGIGKTSLVDEFLQRAAGDCAGLLVARGQCIEGYGGKEAYYPVLEALGQLCGGSEGASVVQILATQAPTWLVQFPALINSKQREMLQREILGATRERMLREIGDALEKITSEKPLLLVLDDLQWADSSTVDLISALARRRAPGKLMLIGIYRPVDVTLADHPLKEVKRDLLVHGLCREIALEPLRETDVAEYLATGSAEPSAVKDLAGLIYRHTEGNPLFMVAALDHLQDRGLIVGNGGWRVTASLETIDLEVPESLRQVIELQIERLSEEEQRVLEVASVTGAWFTTAVRATVATIDAERFEDICEDLARRHQIVRPAGPQEFPDGTRSARYEFVHALYRKVLYNRQSPGRRVKLHLHVGERLEALYAPRPSEAAPELAQHFELGGDALRALKYLQIAADTAGQRFEPRQAADILEHALKLVRNLSETERAEYETAILRKLAMICLAWIRKATGWE